MLYAESLDRVELHSGNVEGELGSERRLESIRGAANLTSLSCTFLEFEIGVEADGIALAPRLCVLPAGHSQASRALFSGGSGKWPHWEEWRTESPAGSTARTPKKSTRPGTKLFPTRMEIAPVRRATETGLWCFLVSGDNGATTTEGSVGRDSAGADIVPSLSCNQ